MKKFYAVIAGAAMLSTSFLSAQIINDDLESYTLGNMAAQNPTVWSTWSGTPTGATAEDLTVSDIRANSGNQSGLVSAGANPSGGPQDVLLLLGNRNSGEYTLDFQMFIPTGKTGYFNIQGTTVNGGAGPAATPGNGVFNSGNITFNLDGDTPGVVSDISGAATPETFNTFSYPENAWFPVAIYVNLDSGNYILSIDGVKGSAIGLQEDNILGAIDFFAVGPNNEYYIDDVLFREGNFLSTPNFKKNTFTFYPNPVKDKLTIQSQLPVDSIVIYDLLGKKVFSKEPKSVSPDVDMSGLPSGAYLVTVNIGGISNTIKVLK